MNQSRFRKAMAATAIAASAAFVLAACSGGGAEKSTDAASGARGGGGNSGYTFAMITHETPGDTFWDRIKAGRPAGRQGHRVDAEVLQRPRRRPSRPR